MTSAYASLPLPGAARYLKEGIASGQQLRDPQIVERVSAMLLDIDRHGMDAVRRYSRELDGYAPERFRAMYPRLDEFRAVRDRVDPEGVLRSDLSTRLGMEGARA